MEKYRLACLQEPKKAAQDEEAINSFDFEAHVASLMENQQFAQIAAMHQAHQSEQIADAQVSRDELIHNSFQHQNPADSF